MVIVVSYGTDLPRKFGRRARSIVKQPIYRRIFGAELSADSAAADEWTLTNGSEWMASGILAGITGNRADGIVWDDLIKGREQADSEPVRQKTWDAYLEDLLTRRKPNAWEVGITTRWHEDDVAGRILPEHYNGESGWISCRDGNDWYVVCLPAECERNDDLLGRKPGDILWPEWFSPKHFAPFRRNARTWSALFQQRPAPETGDYFNADWLRSYTNIPDKETMRIYGASDCAVSQDKNDYTVHLIVGVDPDDDIYLLDLWRAQTSADIWIEKYCDMVKDWRPMGWAEESGQISSGIGPFLHKRLMERKLYLARTQFPARADKAIRARSIQGRMASRGLYVPTTAPWYPAFKAELMTFPYGRNDDQVDALGLIGQVLDRMVGGSPKPEPAAPPKILSTDNSLCTVTLEDLWEINDRDRRSGNLRIH
jgi:predicted phage terminase large subunit-like protein